MGVNDVLTHSQVPLIPKGEALYKGQGSLGVILRILPTTLDHGKSDRVMNATLGRLLKEKNQPASYKRYIIYNMDCQNSH